jgi:hypothetical protein
MHYPKLFHKSISITFTKMSIFIRYILDYFKTEFNLWAHVFTGLFLALAIYLNYAYEIYNTLAWSHKDQFSSVYYILLLYLIAFGVTSAIVTFTKKGNNSTKLPLRNKKFLLFGTIGLIFLSLDSSYYLMKFVRGTFHSNYFVSVWINSCISNLSSFLSVIIPLYIVYYSVRYFKPEYYGLRLNGAHIKPYFWLILFMFPLIYLASFQPDFLHTYPTYNDLHEYRFLGVSQWVTAGIYELCYGFDFLSVELFFRGFMVIALSKFVGKDAILPMVAVYCFLHFGKPAGETISSIFGGYILGILAYKSRNIYGGLIAHLGVAWGMEYMAYLHS